MTPTMYGASAALLLLALVLIVVPLLRHRKEGGVGVTLTIMVLAFPLLVLTIYSYVSTYPWDDQTITVQQPASGTAAPVDEMITELAARLEQEPDVEGYILLARSYIQLQRWPDAVDAWHRAWELTEGKSPEVSLGYAEALILADQRTLKTSAADLLEQVLVELPDSTKALWYGAISASARGLNDLAIERYAKLSKVDDLPPNMRLVVQEQLAELGASASAQDAAPDTPDAAEEGATKGLVIRATITVDAALAELAPSGATLFLFARDKAQAGPPLAVKRMRPRTFPLEVKLSDANAMVAGRKLADASELEVVARISSTGSAIEAAGDLYGVAYPDVSVEEPRIEIVIDSVSQ